MDEFTKAVRRFTASRHMGRAVSFFVGVFLAFTTAAKSRNILIIYGSFILMMWAIPVIIGVLGGFEFMRFWWASLIMFSTSFAGSCMIYQFIRDEARMNYKDALNREKETKK